MMGLQIDVGDGSSACPDIITIAVNPGDTVNIANNAASPGNLTYYTNGIDGAGTSLAAGANVNVTVPTWIQSAGGVCTVKLTGGQYGA